MPDASVAEALAPAPRLASAAAEGAGVARPAAASTPRPASRFFCGGGGGGGGGGNDAKRCGGGASKRRTGKQMSQARHLHIAQ